MKKFALCLKEIALKVRSFILRFKKFEIAAAIALLVSFTLGVFGFCDDCEVIRNSVLRLHVIANSDCTEDQQIKLEVRDAVLEAGKDIFDGSVTADEAVEKILPQKDKIIKAAKAVLKKKGYDSTISLSVEKEYFDTRCYEQFTMPAGEYMAVKLTIGEGKGKNWWCVMFPPLCVGAADSGETVDAFFSEDGAKIVKSSPRYEPRFKIVEIIEKIKEKF